MGIKTFGLKDFRSVKYSEKPPHHMGIKTHLLNYYCTLWCSEKPPHHMGIKTTVPSWLLRATNTLKNLPTTWGLRQYTNVFSRGLQGL